MRNRIDDDQREYTEREFALVLRKAAELSRAPGPGGLRSSGLSLGDMKEIAAELGIDPVLVERAAALLPRRTTGTAIERLIGGPVKLRLEHSVDVKLTEDRAARLLTALRAAAEQHGRGEVDVGGLSWRSDGEVSRFFVTAQGEKDGTRVRVTVDRGGALLLTGFLNVMGGIVAVGMTGAILDPESAAVGVAIVATGLAGALATARAVWSATTRTIGEKADSIMDALTRSLLDSGGEPSQDDAAASGPEGVSTTDEG